MLRGILLGLRTMLLEHFESDLSPVALSVALGGILGLVFGAAAQVSRFCLRRGLVSGDGRRAALGVWLTALLAALLGVQAAVAAGLVDLSAHRIAAADVPVLAVLAGGALFGAGMVLTRGCVSRLTVLGASGNLRGLLVLAIFAIVAHATLKGVLAPLRVAAGSVTLPLGDAALASAWPGGALVWTAGLALVLAAIVLRSGARPVHLALAAVIGLLVPLGWFGTGVLLYDDFDPIPLETLSFTAPWADTLFWAVASTSIPAGFGTGLVGGVIAGAFTTAALRGDVALQSFESPEQTLRYALGAGLMGVGGVMAGGCTVGAGLSGVSALSVAAGLALLAMMAGAVATDRLWDGRRGRAGAMVLAPAE